MGIIEFDLDAIAALPEALRAEARVYMQEYERLRKEFPLATYEPLGPKHHAFHSNPAPVRALFGGNRAGKTTTGIVDDIIQATPRELVEQLAPHLLAYKKFDCPFYCRIMAPDMKRTMIPVIHQKLKEWLPKALLAGGRWENSYRRTDEVLTLECGCRFDFLSYEMDVDKFGGAALHRCHYDEEPPQAIREESMMRLIDFGGDEVFCMTPLQGLTYTYRELWKKRKDPDKFCVAISMDDNWRLDEETKQRTLAMYDDEKLAARRDGLFVHFEGLVYPEWDRCVSDEPLMRDDLQGRDVIVGIDPGVRWCGLVWGAFDDENHCTIFHAVKLRNQIVENWVEVIREVNRSWGLREPQYVIDPSARARTAVNAQTVEGELADYGIYASWGQNDVEEGVLQGRRRMRSGMLRVVGGACRDLVEECEDYRIDEDTADGRFRVVKENDHCADAMRYLLMERPFLPEPVVPEDRWDPEVAQPPHVWRARRQEESVMGLGA